MYRDGSNYKQWGSIIFAGELTETLRQRLVAALDSEEFFIADQVRVPEVFPDSWPMYDDDHCWHEWAGWESADSEPTDAFARSIEQFVDEVEGAAAAGWRDFDPQDRRRGILGS